MNQEKLTADDALYILNAMKKRDYKPKINQHTGTDYNEMNRAALDYAISIIEAELLKKRTDSVSK